MICTKTQINYKRYIFNTIMQNLKQNFNNKLNNILFTYNNFTKFCKNNINLETYKNFLNSLI